MKASANSSPQANAVQFHGHTFALEQVPCDFCGSTEFHPFWQHMRHGLDLSTVLCKNCGLCMTNPRPTAEANTLFYSQLYNLFHKRDTPLEPGCPYVLKSRRLAQPRVDVLAKFLNPEQPPKVFEIGAGVGQFQVAARERTKWAISGLEPGNEQSALCKKLGLDVTQAFFQTLPIADESLDAVVSFHVLEHVDSPAEFVRHANRILRPGGLLHLEVPNLTRWGEGSLSEFLQFPHLFSFTAPTLRNYLTTLGGFRPVYTAEKTHSLTMVARKIASAVAGTAQSSDFERFDVVNFMQRLHMMERVRKLTRWIPRRMPLAEKVASTLDAI